MLFCNRVEKKGKYFDEYKETKLWHVFLTGLAYTLDGIH